MRLEIDDLKQVDELIIGGVPLLDDIKKLVKNKPNTSNSIRDLGFEYGDMTIGDAGEYFKDKIIEAGENEKEQADTYQYSLTRTIDISKHTIPPDLTKYNIKDIQRTLNKFGFNLTVDGVWGKNTASAVENFGIDYLIEELESTTNDYCSADRYINTALNELGTKEWHGADNNPEVMKYHHSVASWFSTDEIPWCGSFVNWVMKTNGYIPPKQGARAKAWLDFGMSFGVPTYGAIAVKSRKGGGHVCFVIGATNDGKYLYCLGGNQHDEVSIVKYRKEVFLDFRVPLDYDCIKPLIDIAEAQDYKQAGKEN